MKNIKYNQSVIVFTDLDGTLMDLNTYSFKPALPALQQLQELKVPVILVSSKTVEEMRHIAHKLNLSWPFIAENGSVIFNNHTKIPLGKSFSDLVTIFDRLRQSFPIQGFHQLSINKITELTGLSAYEAKMAKEREYSIPFLILPDASNGEMISNLQKQIETFGCRLRKGGRFYHLLGDTDKGKAILKMLDVLFKEYHYKPEKTVGFGDAPNDLDMFQVVDLPIQVEKPGGGYHPLPEDIPSLIRIRGEGPSGWFRAFQEIISPILKH